MISYTSEIGTYSANDSVTFFSAWASSGSSITLAGTVYTVDPFCPTKVESLTDEDRIAHNSPDTLKHEHYLVKFIWSLL